MKNHYTVEDEPTFSSSRILSVSTLEPLKIPFSVCKVTDYSGIDIDQPLCFPKDRPGEIPCLPDISCSR